VREDWHGGTVRFLSLPVLDDSVSTKAKETSDERPECALSEIERIVQQLWICAEYQETGFAVLLTLLRTKLE
jgi:hypothetical protein